MKNNKQSLSTVAQVMVLRLETDIAYFSRFLGTLGLNRIEREHQKEDQPIVFFKYMDATGVVEEFWLNPIYKNQVPEPKTHFNKEDVTALIEYFKQEGYRLLETWVRCGRLEHEKVNQISEAAAKEDQDKAIPVLPPVFKTYNEMGLPVSYKLLSPQG